MVRSTENSLPLRNWIAFSFVLSLAVRFYLTATRRFDGDEFEHLHAAWMIHSGFDPYRDFWQNHSPLLYYLLAPLFTVLDEGSAMMLVVRFLLSISGVIIIWQTYLLARMILDRTTAVLSAMILSCSYLFIHKTLEIRPDQLLVIFWLSSLMISIRAFETKESSGRLIFAGTLLGIGMLFSPKALLCLAAAVFTFFLVQHFLRARSLAETIQYAASNIAGFLLPVALFVIFLDQKDLLHLFLDYTVFGNLNFPEGRKLSYLLNFRYLILFLFGVAGLILIRRRLRDVLWIGIPMLFLVCVFLLLLPTSNPQSALIFVPFLAIFGGIAMKKAIETRKPALIIFVFVAGSIVPCASALYEKKSTPTNAGQLELIDALLKATTSRDAIFDGNIAYVFRPQAFYYGSLIDAVRFKMSTGEIKESIPESLKQHHCKFVIYDDRVLLLPETIQQFLRENYIPTESPDVLVAGKHLGPEFISGNKAIFWIQIPLIYEISMHDAARERVEFTVDGKIYTSPVYLQEGRHEIVSDAPLRSVMIRAAKAEITTASTADERL